MIKNIFIIHYLC